MRWKIGSPHASRDDRPDVRARPRGRITFSGGNVIRISLKGDRWVTNATIDGTARWNQQTGNVTARLTVGMAASVPVTIVAHWRVYARPHQLAVVTGREGTRHLAAVLAAP
jgi:hypothetical protein